MQDTSILRIKNFSKKARPLRAYFDQVFKDPRHSHPARFVWDHWHLENQYRQHRALARHFLPPELYTALKNELVTYGQNQLGCHSISEPWISYYTEGDFQDLHTDSPHGPWAYVLSLTHWSRARFTGGETQVLRPEILNYWAHYQRQSGLENATLFETIPPHFNQLLVFDPRRPHRVRRVGGVHEPTEGRLVIHGWFVHPEPFVVGGHKTSAITKTLNRELPALFQNLDVSGFGTGVLTLEISITASGKTSSVKYLTNSLMATTPQRPALLRQLAAQFLNVSWGRAPKGTRLILPLVFD